ncbi:MAG: DUF115 domain-containing protein [Spirochaetaceae bacterium]|nr:MAG: DUF115 domain-containing protein [Spirochaetaceae bacterium]
MNEGGERTTAAAPEGEPPKLEPSYDERLQREPTRSGEVTASLDGVRLHSVYDPRREARRLIEAELAPECEVVVCYGLGLAYHVEELLTMRPEAKLLVVEPDTRLLEACTKVRDLRPVLSNSRVRLLSGVSPEAVAMVLDEQRTRDLVVLRLRSVYEKDREYYEAVDAAVARLRSRAEINRNTLKRFGKLWVRNLTRNLEQSAAAIPLRLLDGLATDIPVLLCAAGPSLDQVLPRIAELAERCIVVAVDTSVAALMAAGVQPDIAVVVDPQYWNTRHLDAAREFSGILVSESSTHPRVFRLLNSADCVFCASLFPLGRVLEEALGHMGTLGAGGSVATAAWDLARRIGTSQVISAGLDLGFPGRATHCKNSFFEERARLLCSRIDPLESHSFRYLHDAAPYLTESADGGSVLTDKRMEIYRRWFENQLQQQPEPPAYTLSGAGVAMKGVRSLSLEEAAALPSCRTELNTRIDEFRSKALAYEEYHAARASGIARLIEQLCNELSQLQQIAERGAQIAEQAIPSAGGAGSGAGAGAGTELEHSAHTALRLHDYLRLLDDVDQEIGRLHFRDVAGFLIQETVDDIERGRTRTGNSALENSRRLYIALAQSAQYHEQLLRSAGARLSQ